MGIDYKYYDFQLHEYLVCIKQELQKLRWHPMAEEWYCQIQEEMERIKTKKFRVAVVGEFKRGKTSLINALLGKRILPENIEPATATINRIVYGNLPNAYLILKDGTKQQIAIEQLEHYVTKRTKESLENAQKIQEAVVEYPSLFCQNYVELIDTPGMNDDYQMNQITIDYLKNVDLAIVAVSAMNLFGETEANFVAQLVEHPEIDQIVIVVTYIDQIQKRERERLFHYLKKRICESVLEVLKKTHSGEDSVLQKYETIFQNLHIYGVSSTSALAAREQNNQDLFVESGLERFSQELPEIILRSQSNNSISKAMNKIADILKDYEKKAEIMYQDLITQEYNLSKLDELLSQIQQWKVEIFSESLCTSIMIKIASESKRKDIIKQEFIQCLSEIDDLDPEKIELKLRNQMIASFQHMKQLLNEETYPSIEQILNQIWKTERFHLSEKLLHLLDNQNGFQETRKMIQTDFNQLNYHNPKREPFGWIVSLIPSREQIMHDNLIYLIMNSVEQSLLGFCQREQNTVLQWIKEEKQRFMQLVDQIVDLMQKEKAEERINVQQIRDNIDWKKQRNQLQEIYLKNEKLKEQFLKEQNG